MKQQQQQQQAYNKNYPRELDKEQDIRKTADKCLFAYYSGK
jgi:hypothetical protein